MARSHWKNQEYRGFEQGPIRPPSEAQSLLIRITRNCPWNRCTFCPVYKGTQFSLRPVEHVLEDIERVHRYVEAIRQHGSENGKIYQEQITRIARDGKKANGEDRAALNSALHWGVHGMRSIFLQDANSLVIKPEELLTILNKLQQCFPWVERITSYARSHSIARISDENLHRMYHSGLTRIHIGMESGSDKVLKLVKKGVDKKTHIVAGNKVKAAGMELSEYIMPGLGGRELSEDHANESADALNQINPDFIRLRSLAIPNHVELFKQQQEGQFRKLTDTEVAQELLLFVDKLDGINSYLASDHILNLFQDLEGRFPEDKGGMKNILTAFLATDPYERMIYQVGRRMGLFAGQNDLTDPARRTKVEQTCMDLGITPENVDSAVDELMKRFI